LGKDLAVQKNFSWPEPSPKYYFLLFYTIKYADDLTQARPKKLGPTYPVGRSWVELFLAQNNWAFFCLT
jgi:hypothetical protein